MFVNSGLIPLIIEAGNVAVNRVPSPLSFILSIHSKVAAAIKKNQEPAWDAITKQALRNQLVSAEDAGITDACMHTYPHISALAGVDMPACRANARVPLNSRASLCVYAR